MAWKHSCYPRWAASRSQEPGAEPVAAAGAAGTVEAAGSPLVAVGIRIDCSPDCTEDSFAGIAANL